MKIMIGICHPKDVHFWKYVINNLKNDGHEVKILAWDKDVTLYLLNAYGFKYELMGESYKSLVGKLYDMFKSDLKVFKVANRFRPNIYVHGEPYLAHVSKVFGKSHIDFCDTDHAKLVHLTTFPFSDAVVTPACFKKKINPKKHITFDGYSELAYLHPMYFKPDQSVLDDFGMSKENRYIILRFVAWSGSHDIGQQGFTDKEKFVRELKDYARILITSEQKLSKDLEKYRITIPPEKMHDLLYYATMYIGEGATMASEAAVLGTPAIYINTLRLGYLDELEEKYGLVYNFSDKKTAQEQAIRKAIELLEDKDVKNKWLRKREIMLREKTDVTKFLTDFIEYYPKTLKGQED
jgi:predicted glycosyltransferase